MFAGQVGSRRLDPTLPYLLTDNVSGLAAITLPATTTPGASYAQGGALNATVEHGYDFDLADNLTATVSVTSTDRAGNVATPPFTIASLFPQPR